MTKSTGCGLDRFESQEDSCNVTQSKLRKDSLDEINVEHLLVERKVLASYEYLAMQNIAIMILTVHWAKKQNLEDNDIKQYKENWKRGLVLEKEHAKLVWNFEFNLRTTLRSLGMTVGQG